LERDTLKQKEVKLQKIWEEIKTNLENADFFLILNKLSKLVGKEEIN